MSCCSGNSQAKTSNPAELSSTQLAIQKLANLLLSTPEYKEFIRLSDAINNDPEVTILIRQIRFGRSIYNQSAGDNQTTDDLKIKLETMPIMKEYRSAEQRVRELFKAVDQSVSNSLGLNFAVNAKISGCG